MTQQEGPPRLKASKEGPQELRSALRALGHQHTHPLRLERAAEKLRLLEAVPLAPSMGPAQPAAWLRVVRSKVLLGRIAVALLAALGGAVWFSHSTPHPQGPLAEPSRREPSRMVEPTGPNVFASRVQAPPERGTALSDRAPQVDGTKTVAPSVSPVRPAAARASSNVTRAKERRRGAAEPPGSVFVTTATTPRDVRAEQPESASARVRPRDPVTQAPPERSGELSEIELLFAARQTLRSDPRAGLGLLDEHRARFPEGQLAPEREVLAIEVLRKLGQAELADERFTAFRRRYADSLHMQRLRQPE